VCLPSLAQCFGVLSGSTAWAWGENGALGLFLKLGQGHPHFDFLDSFLGLRRLIAVPEQFIFFLFGPLSFWSLFGC
jgi:hypothetical protein